MVAFAIAPGGERHSPESSKRGLSPARKWLVELMQRINFGRIEDLVIVKGEPVLDPPPRVIQELKFGGENGPRPESQFEDFALKSQVLERSAEFDRRRSFAIEVLVVKHGIPFNMNLETDA